MRSAAWLAWRSAWMGAEAATHDAFRGVTGSFDRSLRALRGAREVRLESQVNTTVTRRNMDSLNGIAQLVAEAGARLWSVFFLVAIGRASEQDDLTAEEYEQVFGFLYGLSKSSPFDIKTTEAPHLPAIRSPAAEERGRKCCEPGTDRQPHRPPRRDQ